MCVREKWRERERERRGGGGDREGGREEEEEERRESWPGGSLACSLHGNIGCSIGCIMIMACTVCSPCARVQVK